MIPLRFDLALNKLYNAFHDGNLHPECCKQCAVGNILDQTDSWRHFTEQHGSINLSYVGKVNEAFGKRFNGYKPSELLQIEAEFLKGCGYQLPLHHRNYRPKDKSDKTILFNGLYAAITYLCKLDGIENVMDIEALLRNEVQVNTPEMVA